MAEQYRAPLEAPQTPMYGEWETGRVEPLEAWQLCLDGSVEEWAARLPRHKRIRWERTVRDHAGLVAETQRRWRLPGTPLTLVRGQRCWTVQEDSDTERRPTVVWSGDSHADAMRHLLGVPPAPPRRFAWTGWPE